MSTTVAYHDDRPAINVKVHTAGVNYWPRAFTALPGDNYGAKEIAATTAADCVDAAYNIVQSNFWQSAEQIATERGMGDIESDGRSGGWLVFTDGRDPKSMNDPDGPPYSVSERRDWLDGYAAVREWAEAFIADAPERVASLAQQIAMDELGRSAAERMFGR